MAAVAEKTYYELLGVKRDADGDAIRKAYLKLAHEYHPDKTGGDKKAEEKLKAINEAYDTLKNPEKRKEYDELLDAKASFGAGGFGSTYGSGGFTGDAGPGFSQTFRGGAGDPFGDIFSSFFGGTRESMRPRAQRGNDVEGHVDISLRECVEGTRRTIQLAMEDACPACHGSGAAAGTQPKTCPQCSGTGYMEQARGPFSMTQPCTQCHGTGTIISTPCAKCGGAGRVKSRRNLSVDIPAGVASGTRLRLAGEGEPGANGGPKGDLYVVVRVTPDERFERDGKNLIVEVPVRVDEAMLGATIEVPTLTGKAKLKVPAGTQSGSLLRMRGLGLPDVKRGAKGDQLVRIQVELPKKLSREQRELLERFAKLTSPDDFPKRKHFLHKLK